MILGAFSAVRLVSVFEGVNFMSDPVPVVVTVIEKPDEPVIADLPEELHVPAAAVPAIIALDISNPFFLMTKFYVKEEDLNAYLTGENDRAILSLCMTPYREATELHPVYREYVNSAAEKEATASKKYPVNDFSGEMNLTSNPEKAYKRGIHINYKMELQRAAEDRKHAHEYSTTYQNVKELGNYYFSLGDVSIRLEEYSEAYRMYLESINYYVIALQLSITSSSPTNNAIFAINQLSKLYGMFRLQDPRIAQYFISDSGSLEQLQQTVTFYQLLLQRVGELKVD